MKKKKKGKNEFKQIKTNEEEKNEEHDGDNESRRNSK